MRTNPDRQDRPDRRGLWIGAALVVALGLILLFWWGPLGGLIGRLTRFLADKEGARAYILSFQPYAALYFIGLQILQVVLSPIPGELSGFLGGFIFGWDGGFLYSTLGLTLGSLVCVSLGRAFERVFLEKILPAAVLDGFSVRVDRWGLPMVFILFLIPGAPKDYLSYLFGLSRLPIWSFLLVSALGRMPGTLVLSLQGAKVFQGDWTFFAVLTGASLLVLVPALIFKDRIFRRLGLPAGNRER
ncbi:MAG: VTT domain-containing protein [Proteobacteria bacterium]|nr:VTT domain-containing protein [Pseudomonadota bacterium]